MTLSIEKQVLSWIDLARCAPSGGNAQPWAVECQVDGDQVLCQVFVDPQQRARDNIFSSGGLAHVMALGAFAYGLELAARRDGFALASTAHSGATDPWAARFTLTFTKTPRHLDGVEDLPAYLEQRKTNRQPFQRRPLEREHVSALRSIVGQYPEMTLTEFEAPRLRIAWQLLPVELIRWAHRRYVDGFMRELNMKADGSGGLPFPTLGLPSFMRPLFQYWTKHRWVDRLLSWGLKLPFAIGNLLAPVWNSSGLFFLQAGDDTLWGAFQTGKLYHHLTLELQRRGVSSQPVGLPLICYLASHHGDANFTERQLQAVMSVAERFSEQHGVDFARPALGFRLGYCDRVAPRSGRRSVKPVIGTLSRAPPPPVRGVRAG